MARNERKTFSSRGSAADPTRGSLQHSPDSLAGGEGDWLPLLKLPLISALLASLLLFPYSKKVPLGAPHLMQAGDAPESDIGYTTETCVFLCIGVYCFCIQALGLVFHIVGYISTVVKSVVCVYSICAVLH